ncbi:MAG: metallo-dependent hydrolase, partial [Negativicutes bacterium]|nr:metallo-dependent hydrolase [Negativicutes bacterium]
MKQTILISGGRVIDPARGINEKSDILVEGGRIVASVKNGSTPGSVIRAEGCLVLPGLIDYHTHVFSGATENGCPPDIGALPYGVTTVVDAGSAGTANYEIFHGSVIAGSAVRIKSFLSVSPTGQTTMKYDENHDPKFFDEDAMEQLFHRYPDELLGLKLRLSSEVVGDLGFSPLIRAKEIAEQLKCRIAVHTTNPPGETAELAGLFRPGDIFAHMYHGKGSTIIGSDQRVLPSVKDARRRGVIFDAANGRSHFAFKTAEAALADGFAPDVISTDLGWVTAFKQPVFGLPWLMSKYLALDMALDDIVAACTSAPARLLAMETEIGTLAPGACADIAILKPVEHTCEFFDALG